MASLQTLERRIQALEARLADVEGGFGETIYRLRRSTVRTDLRLTRVMDHLGIEDVSEEDVDAELDRE
jgi:uncharacterized coiled-coil protein SlyX